MTASTSRPAAATEVRSIVVAGRQLRVAVRHGDGTRVPLLLFNGIGASLDLLQPFVDALGYPGAVDVLGISWGGGVAQHFAITARRRCRRLVLVSTATGAIMVPARPAVLVQMITPRRYLDPGHLQRVAPKLYGGTARGDPAWVSTMMHAQSRVGSPRGYLYQLTAGAGWTSLPFLPLLRQPTLILSGDDDPLIPVANARLLRTLIPHARLHVYHGGHLSLVTEAAELAPVVDRFLTAADPAAIPDHPPAPGTDP